MSEKLTTNVYNQLNAIIICKEVQNTIDLNGSSINRYITLKGYS